MGRGLKTSMWLQGSLGLAVALACSLGVLTSARAADGDTPPSAATSDSPPPASPAAAGDTTGFKLGPFRMHALLSLAAGYDSNTFYSAGAADPMPIEGAPLLRVTTRLEGSTTTSSSVDGKVMLGLAWNQYFTRPAIEQSDLAAELGINLVLNPNAPLSFLIQENFIRYVDSSYSPTSAVFNPFNQGDGPRLDRDVNRFGLGLRLKPGHGAFSVDLLYANTIIWYESSALDLGRSMRNDIHLRSKWKFFPKTALIHEFSFGYWYFFEKGTTTSGYYNIDSFPLTTYLGVVGLLTPRLEFLVKAGYGNSFHRLSDPANTGRSYEGPLAVVSLGYRAGLRTRITLFYEHTFDRGLFANYYTLDVGKLSVDQGIAERVIVHAEVIFGYLNYDTAPIIPGVGLPPQDRVEFRLGGNLSVDFYIFPWLTVGASYSISANFTDYIVDQPPDGPDDPSYVRHVFLGNVTVRY